MDSHEYIGEETEVLTQQRKVISFVATLVTIILIRHRYRLVRTIERAPLSKRVSQRNDYLNMVIYESDDTCLNMFHMKRELFFRFCQELRNKGLRNRGDVSVEEQVAMFLQIVGHNIKNRVIKTNFIQSGQTVSRYFCDVLFAVGELRGDYLKLPNAETSDYIKKNRRFTPFFDNCIEPIDGTHIPATPPPDNIGAFRGRKGVTQNVLAAVDFDLRFLYVLAGYEGSAHDAIVLANALEREDGSIPIIEGKYYLADAGYSTRPGFITPFRGMRYHLSEFSNNPPANDKELFNHRHSCLRTVIERAFGALKNRFKILTSKPFFPWSKQVDIVLGCCIIHNFIIHHMNGPDMYVPSFEEVAAAVPEDDNEPHPRRNRTARQMLDDIREWKNIRDAIMRQMWEQRNYRIAR